MATVAAHPQQYTRVVPSYLPQQQYTDTTITEPGQMQQHDVYKSLPQQHPQSSHILHEQLQPPQQYAHKLSDTVIPSPSTSTHTIQPPLHHSAPSSSNNTPQQYYQQIAYAQSPIQQYSGIDTTGQHTQPQSHSGPTQSRQLPQQGVMQPAGSPLLTGRTSSEDAARMQQQYYAQQLQQQYLMQQLQQQAMMVAMQQQTQGTTQQSTSTQNTPLQQYNQRLSFNQSQYQQQPTQAYMPMQFPYMQQMPQQMQHVQQTTPASSYKAVIECGIVNRATGQRVLTMYEPYFGKEVEIYTAVTDPQQRPLYRASLLSDKFDCASNKLCMYLSRRRSAADGVYQSTSFLDKPTGHTGLKAGNYFVTMSACQAFERHYLKQQNRRTAKEQDELAKSQQSSAQSVSRTITKNETVDDSTNEPAQQLHSTNSSYDTSHESTSIPRLPTHTIADAAKTASSSTDSLKREYPSNDTDESGTKKLRTDDGEAVTTQSTDE